MSQTSSGTSPQQIDGEYVQTIAARQRAIIVCILVYLVALISQCFVPEKLRLIIGIGMLVVSIAATVFVFMLATKLYGTGVGVLLGILTLIPLIGLVVLLVVNGKATSTLKEHGVAVGLLGAKGPVT